MTSKLWSKGLLYDRLKFLSSYNGANMAARERKIMFILDIYLLVIVVNAAVVNRTTSCVTHLIEMAAKICAYPNK